MDQPTIAARQPAVITLEAGSYWWCRCGKSKTQPFCDGSHAGSSFEPIEVVIAEKRKVALCNCKHAKTKPFCDGSHRQLP